MTEIREMKNPPSKTFCSKPWNDIFIINKGYSPCCLIKSNEFNSLQEYLSSDYLKGIKDSLLAGERHPACYICWEHEDSKVWSNRVTLEVEDFDNPKILIAGIDFANTCNLACQMCSPNLSTTWGKRMNKRDGSEIKVWKTLSSPRKKLEFYKEILPNLIHLSLSGGEPFQSPDHLEFLKIAPLINKDLCLSYNSNVSNLYFKGEYIPKYFKKFNNVSVSASIDGYGLANDYQRLNSKWDSISKNVLELKEYVTNIHATPTIYTMFSMGDLLQWGSYHDIPVDIYMIPHGYLHPFILPKEVKIAYIEKISNQFRGYSHILKQFRTSFFSSIMEEPSNKEELTKQFKRETVINNKESPIQFPDFAPELKDWYDSILL